MQYAVLSKLSQPQGRAVCAVSAPVPVGTGAEFRGRVVGELVLTNVGAVILARGRIGATVIRECSRCLTPHEVPLDIEVSEECRLDQIDRALPGPEEPEPIPILDGDMVDLTELLRQALVLNVPSRSLCRPDCAGLCSHCGRNLNCGPCDCHRELSDPRWAALRDVSHD